MLVKKPGLSESRSGATGAVGAEMIEVLEERKFPIETLIPLASARSAGGTVLFAGQDVTILELTKDSFEGVDIALFSAGGGVSREYGPIAAKAGAVVIDNSSAWRMDPDVPLVVPEVNIAATSNGPRDIIANPNCSTIQMVVALKPLHDARADQAHRRVDLPGHERQGARGGRGAASRRRGLVCGAAAPGRTCSRVRSPSTSSATGRPAKTATPKKR